MPLFCAVWHVICTIYESTINNCTSSDTVGVRVDQADEIDYSMTLTPPEGFEGTKLMITTLLTNTNDDDTFYNSYNFDKLVKSQKAPFFVISAKAKIQENQTLLGSRFRGSDGLGDFLRIHRF